MPIETDITFAMLKHAINACISLSQQNADFIIHRIQLQKFACTEQLKEIQTFWK